MLQILGWVNGLTGVLLVSRKGLYLSGVIAVVTAILEHILTQRHTNYQKKKAPFFRAFVYLFRSDLLSSLQPSHTCEICNPLALSSSLRKYFSPAFLAIKPTFGGVAVVLSSTIR